MVSFELFDLLSFLWFNTVSMNLNHYHTFVENKLIGSMADIFRFPSRDALI